MKKRNNKYISTIIESESENKIKPTEMEKSNSGYKTLNLPSKSKIKSSIVESYPSSYSTSGTSQEEMSMKDIIEIQKKIRKK